MGNDKSMASGLLAAAIIWALVLIGLFGPQPPKAHSPAECVKPVSARG